MQTVSPDLPVVRVTRRCQLMLTGGGAGSCPSQPVPTAQPGWAMGLCWAAGPVPSTAHRTGLRCSNPLATGQTCGKRWAPGQLPLGTTCVALPLSDSTAQSFHRTIIPDYSWQGCPLVSKSCKSVNDQEGLISAKAEVCMMWCPWGTVLVKATPLRAQGIEGIEDYP